MYVEKRKFGESIKYYLVHSYRENAEVLKIRRYLGINLTSAELERRKRIAEKTIQEVIKEFDTEIFNFSLSKKRIEELNKYDKQIRIHHLEIPNWKTFTENFVYNTNAIEGSTVQLEEVKEILEKRRTVVNSEEIETKNVARAVEFIRNTKEDLSLNLIKKIHRLCFENSKDFAGKFRDIEVVIQNSKNEVVHRGVPVSELGKVLKELIIWYEKNKKNFKPLILASIVHNQFEYIHPFQDGNGRVGRLLLNFILIKNKYPPINIMMEDRADYYSSLQEYSKNHDLKPTVKFLINQYNKMLKKVSTKDKNKNKVWSPK